MKKTLKASLSALMALVLCLSLAACGSTNSVGVWTIGSITEDGTTYTLAEYAAKSADGDEAAAQSIIDQMNITMEFKADGTVITSVMGNQVTSTYTEDAKSVTVVTEGQPNSVFEKKDGKLHASNGQGLTSTMVKK